MTLELGLGWVVLERSHRGVLGRRHVLGSNVLPLNLLPQCLRWTLRVVSSPIHPQLPQQLPLQVLDFVTFVFSELQDERFWKKEKKNITMFSSRVIVCKAFIPFLLTYFSTFFFFDKLVIKTFIFLFF